MGTILRAIAVYFTLLVVMRVVGRRSFEQMSPFEMILIFLFGGMGIQAVVSDDRSLTNALLGIMTVALLHVSVAFLKMRSEGFRRLVDGTPIVIVEGGHWHEDRLQRLRLTPQDVMAAGRQAGLEHMKQIQFAVVERNGGISIVRKSDDATEGTDSSLV
jgi:uncharacterized membrane protein YcaP (DUF421 family)